MEFDGGDGQHYTTLHYSHYTTLQYCTVTTLHYSTYSSVQFSSVQSTTYSRPTPPALRTSPPNLMQEGIPGRGRIPPRGNSGAPEL